MDNYGGNSCRNLTGIFLSLATSLHKINANKIRLDVEHNKGEKDPKSSTLLHTM